MKFIVDEQLPFQLASWLKSKGYDAIHANDLPHVLGRLTDTSICQIADAQKRIVITKDEDFWKSYLLTQQPKKLIYLTTGNIKNADLIELFKVNLPTLLELITENNVIEFNRNGFILHF
jgi:predicted nuclease of predicted toxin-antitoxin system